MTDKLYRWVKASERLPENKDEYPIITSMGIYDGWYNKDKDRWLTNYNETFLSDDVEWLEPYTPSASVEQAAQEYADRFYPIKDYEAYESDYDYRTQCAKNEQLKEHFLAGASHSLPCVDIVDKLRKENIYAYNNELASYRITWEKCCDKLQELLNQSK